MKNTAACHQPETLYVRVGLIRFKKQTVRLKTLTDDFNIRALL